MEEDKTIKDEQQKEQAADKQQKQAADKQKEQTTPLPLDEGAGARPLQLLKEKAREDDPKPSASLSLAKIIGGDILSAEVVRSQIWLFLLIVVLTIVYVASRYQCQQDLIVIDRLENELRDAKYKALSTSSTLTERCRESHVLEILKTNKDSVLHTAEQPPYIITVPE